jgi:REP element-mobilizing transposase RayT
MQYDKQRHHRRSIRLKGYDYSQAGAYFITICVKNMECRFGKIENGIMILNEFGTIAYNEWFALEDRFANFELDVFQIMPNHMHAIIVLTDTTAVGATLAVAPNAGDDKSLAVAPNAGDDKSLAVAPNAENVNNEQIEKITETQLTNEGVSTIVGATLAVAPYAGKDNHEQTGDTAETQLANEGVSTIVGATLAVAPYAGNDNHEQTGDMTETKTGTMNGNMSTIERATARVAPTMNANVGDIVGAYKSLVSTTCLKIYKLKNEHMDKMWQRNYYEHIIRNEESYNTIAAYIINNPAKWNEDKFFMP